ncbi:MAG: hypothetical protein EHM24_14275 [Acidobacteria bacterium]|nr:MAG: hypothetical protein EHM24_14275 [Acidobacteriota bacterium]
MDFDSLIRAPWTWCDVGTITRRIVAVSHDGATQWYLEERDSQWSAYPARDPEAVAAFNMTPERLSAWLTRVTP